jgi:CrcB protein
VTRVVLIALAGAVGAVLRSLVDSAVPRYGTVVVNVLGSFVLGLVVGLTGTGTTRLVLGTGLCGAFTTFSAFSFETVRLAEERSTAAATANVVVTVVLCTAAAAIGLALG